MLRSFWYKSNIKLSIITILQLAVSHKLVKLLIQILIIALAYKILNFNAFLIIRIADWFIWPYDCYLMTRHYLLHQFYF